MIGALRLPRVALRALVESRPGYTVIGEADSCSAVIKSLPAPPAVLLIDLHESDLASLRDMRRLLTGASQTRAIVLTGPLERALRADIVRLGAMGLVSKEQPADHLFTAIRTVHSNIAWIDRATMTEALRTIRQKPAKTKSAPEGSEWLSALTRRERDIVKVTLLGLKNRQVADRLFISETTVRHHLTSIFTKLGVRGRYELFRFAYQNGLARPPADTLPPA